MWELRMGQSRLSLDKKQDNRPLFWKVCPQEGEETESPLNWDVEGKGRGFERLEYSGKWARPVPSVGKKVTMLRMWSLIGTHLEVAEPSEETGEPGDQPPSLCLILAQGNVMSSAEVLTHNSAQASTLQMVFPKFLYCSYPRVIHDLMGWMRKSRIKKKLRTPLTLVVVTN